MSDSITSLRQVISDVLGQNSDAAFNIIQAALSRNELDFAAAFKDYARLTPDKKRQLASALESIEVF